MLSVVSTINSNFTSENTTPMTKQKSLIINYDSRLNYKKDDEVYYHLSMPLCNLPVANNNMLHANDPTGSC